MTDLTDIKAAARKAAFARRKTAFDARLPGAAGRLSEVLAGYRGVALSGYMPIRTEIDPVSAMAEASAYGPVGVARCTSDDKVENLFSKTGNK